MRKKGREKFEEEGKEYECSTVVESNGEKEGK